MAELLITENWKDYELLDTGNGEKLEKFGNYTIVRPEPRAIWEKERPQLWNTVSAVYLRNHTGGGMWKFNTPIKDWVVRWENIHFLLKPTGFKHVGVFPEQLPLWKFIRSSIKPNDAVLNLFGYTGGSTLIGAEVGAQVTHVDASKEVVTWARENAVLSKLENKPIRWIVDDVIAFVKREIRRNKKYDGIIIDPPKFGRGTKGEVWKIERDLPKLIDLCTQLLSDKPSFFIINTYTTDYSSLTLANALIQKFTKHPGTITHGELALHSTDSPLIVPCSIFANWRSELLKH